MKKIFLFLTISLIYCEAFAQAPGWQWAVSSVCRQNDQGLAVTSDRFGNVYVAGFFAGDSIIFDMQILYNNSPGSVDMFLAKYDSSGNFQWARTAGGNGDDKAYAVGVDSMGNVFVAGSFYSTQVIFGNDTLTNAGTVGDIFIAKYDATGNLLHAWREGGPSVEIPYAIYVEPGGSLIVAGRFSSSSITFGAFTLNQAGSMDVFVVKYDASGNVLWANGAGGGGNDEAYSLGEDGQQNVYVGGYFNGNATFGSTVLSSFGSSDVFLAKYNPNGILSWARKAGGSGDDRALAITTDANGNTCLAGFYQSATATFGSYTLNSFVTTGNDNSFLARYDSGGTALWARGFNGRSRAEGVAVAGGNVYACGVFRDDTMHVGSAYLLLNGSTDFFVASCDLAGNERWAVNQTSGGAGSEYATSMTSDITGSIITTGYFDSHPIAFGAYSLNNTVSSFDMFTARLASSPVGTTDLVRNMFAFFPNPASDHIIVRGLDPGSELRLYDVTGRLHMCVKHAAGNERIDIRNLPEGLYMLKADGLPCEKIQVIH